MNTKTITIGNTVYEYVRRERIWDSAWVYYLRSRGTTNAYGMVCGKGDIVKVTPWCDRPDFFAMYSASCGSKYPNTLRINPETRKMEDVTARITDSRVAMRPEPNYPHGVCYYRTPILFDGQPV